MYHYDGSILSSSKRIALDGVEMRFVNNAMKNARELIRFWKGKHIACGAGNHFRILAERRDTITAMTAIDTRIRGLADQIKWVAPSSGMKRKTVSVARADEILELCVLILKEHDRHCGALLRSPKVLVSHTRELIEVARAAIKLVS